jgi:MtN3 and saliva related transmembrane protein
MTQIELLGFMAAILTSSAYLPQALMTIRTGVTSGISLLMYGMLTSGKVLWLSYGLLVTSWPLILSQTFTLCLAGIILTLTVRNTYGAAKRPVTVETTA